MDYITFLLLISFVLVSIYLLKHTKSKLPPGPTGFPIIGNLFDIGKRPHDSFTNLAETYGPIMSLKLGTITAIVISSSQVAKQVLQKNDQVFGSRATPDALRALNHHHYSVLWNSTSSPLWRELRKISTTHLFSPQPLDASKVLRQEKVNQLIDYLAECCDSGRAVPIGSLALTTVLNLFSYTLFSIDVASYYKLNEFEQIMRDIMEEAARPNVSDSFPIIRFMDPQGVRRRLAVLFQRLFVLFDRIIDERTRLRSSTQDGPQSKDFLDVLLNLREEKGSQLSLDVIKHLLVDLLGPDTISTTLEWAMAELLHNPEKFTKVRLELEEVLKGRRVQESDISSLSYLQAVVKETYRLHPPSPILIPRKVYMDTELCGFKVSKNANILINAFAIGRDPKTWSTPKSFLPERFLDSEIGVKSKANELIHFGAGRRICLGMPLAQRMFHIMLASLIQSFNWKLENGLDPKDMDMKDRLGLSLYKDKPLMVKPVRL